jgi:hypothetical protein
MTMLALALPSIAVVSLDLRRATPILPVAIGRPGSSPPRSIPKQAFHRLRQQTVSLEIPIASDAPPRPTPAVSLYGPCQDATFQRATGRRISSFVSFFVRSESRFFVPTRTSLALARAEAVRVGRRTNLTTGSAVARPHLDSFEHDGTLGAIGMTIRGEPACGRDQSRHNLVSGGSKDPNHDAVMRIGSEAPKRRTHSPFRH